MWCPEQKRKDKPTIALLTTIMSFSYQTFLQFFPLNPSNFKPFPFTSPDGKESLEIGSRYHYTGRIVTRMKAHFVSIPEIAVKKALHPVAVFKQLLRIGRRKVDVIDKPERGDTSRTQSETAAHPLRRSE